MQKNQKVIWSIVTASLVLGQFPQGSLTDIIKEMIRNGETSRFLAHETKANAAIFNTLGKYEHEFVGTLSVGGIDSNGNPEWSFNGQMRMHDLWDFDYREDRPFSAEVQAWLGRMWMPGKPFHVYSGYVPFMENHTDEQGIW